MRLINFDHYDLNKLKNLVKSHLGSTNSLTSGYVLLDDKSKILGYVILKPENNDIKIDWIYAKKGHGTEFLKRLEKILLKKYPKIILKVSIDPTENKNTVMRRLNFYIKNNYRVYDIKFRKKYGPLLSLHKERI